MTNPPDGSYVATSSGTGMRVDYTYDANGMRKTKTVTTGTLVSTPRNGLHWDEDGVLRYYENGYLMRVGLIWVDGHYYYIKSDGTAVCNQVYWISHNNGLLPNQDYTFNEYGWLTDPVTDEDFDVSMSTHDKVSETLYFDWVLDANNSNSVTYAYTYNGGSLTQMTGDDQTLSFAYDGSGRPMVVTWNGTIYLYLTNIQGDVIAILDIEGNIVVQYTYDAWGNILTTTGTLANTLGTLNPLTYRGYVYDQETQLYYLQSRYYNPEIGRFINADALVATGQGTLGNNMSSYCLNNPVNGCDPCGTCLHRWDFWNDCEKCGGKTIEDKWDGFTTWVVGTYNRINTINQQQRELNTQIIIQQNEMVGNAAKSVWDAYQRGCAMQQKGQLMEAQMMADGARAVYNFLDETEMIDLGVSGYHAVQATRAFKKSASYFAAPIPTIIDESFALGYLVKGLYHSAKVIWEELR